MYTNPRYLAPLIDKYGPRYARYHAIGTTHTTNPDLPPEGFVYGMKGQSLVLDPAIDMDTFLPEPGSFPRYYALFWVPGETKVRMGLAHTLESLRAHVAAKYATLHGVVYDLDSTDVLHFPEA